MTKGRLLLLLRKSQGITQNDAAEHLGISASYLSLIEQGHREPSNSVLMNMADLYQIPAVLLYWNEEDLSRTSTPTEKALMARIHEVIDQLLILVLRRDNP